MAVKHSGTVDAQRRYPNSCCGLETPDEVSLGEWQETQIAILLCESSLLRAHRRELFARTRNSVHILRSQVLRRSVQIQSQNLPKSQEGLMMRRPKFGRSRIISICKQPKKSSLNLVSPIAGTIGRWRHASLSGNDCLRKANSDLSDHRHQRLLRPRHHRPRRRAAEAPAPEGGGRSLSTP